MAKLDADDRASMRRSEFAMPGSKRFPLSDQAHDRMAISGATRSERAGNISASTADKIKAEARSKLGSHPRDHALTMASAAHLHKAGLISTEHHAAIRKHAEKRLAVHKASKPQAYGSMAPQSAGHYMSTVNPGTAQDQDQDGY